MSQTLVERAGEQFSQSAREASRVTGVVADAITNGVDVAKRAAKHGGEAAEDFVNDSTKRIRRNPLLAVAATLVAGIAVGVLASFAKRRK
jgi:ElaB/YqjD/DUF883 family membrane-anchored ribosome-binding protein